jgi:hypothetical protein
MLKALLITGGEVAIPDAVEVNSNEDKMLVDFVDQHGRVLVTFRRADLMVYSKDGDELAGLRSIAWPESGTVPIKQDGQALEPREE